MFEYLQKHILDKGGTDILFNTFQSLMPEEIAEAESKLGFSFPAQLRRFYEEIGYGTLQAPNEYENSYDFYGANEILPPMVVANFSKGILLWEGQGHWMAEPTFEGLEPGDLPFFEIGDSTSFLIMRTNSDNPNAVWTDGLHIKIEDSFEKFIWRLYFESPTFYGDIIEDYYKAHPYQLPDMTVIPEFDGLPIPEQLVCYFTKGDAKAARARLVRVLNNGADFAELKAKIDDVPLNVLQWLVGLMLAKSEFHRKECEELLRLRKKKLYVV